MNTYNLMGLLWIQLGLLYIKDGFFKIRPMEKPQLKQQEDISFSSLPY